MNEPKMTYSISFTKKDWELGDDKWQEFVNKCVDAHQQIYRDLHPNIIA